MDFFERLQHIDRKVIYIVLLIAIALPLLKPIGLPVSVGKETTGIYDAVEALQPGDVVALAFDYSPSSYAEMHPQAAAVFTHLILKPDIKVVMLAFWETGPMFAQEVIDKIDLHGKQYGVDFVNLGYVPGGETAMSAFAGDIHNTFPKDNDGNAISSLPIMENIKTAADINLMVEIAGGSPGVPEMTRQVQGPYKVKYAAGLPAISVPIYMPYMNSGQMIGLMSGLRGAAEYEMLLKQPGKGVGAMDALSTSHLVMIAFIIISNIGYFVQKSRKGGKANVN